MLAKELVEAAIRHKLPFSVVLFDSWYLFKTYSFTLHDTFGRVFGKIDACQFQDVFWEWVWTVNDMVQGQIVNRWKVLTRFR